MHRIIPFGERILVRRNKIGEKAGSILLPQEVQERFTDLAEVVYIPESTLADQELIENAVEIIKGLTISAKAGSPDAMKVLTEFNQFLRTRSIKVGDTVLMGKYIGTDITETGKQDPLTLLFISDIMGLVVKDE